MEKLLSEYNIYNGLCLTYYYSLFTIYVIRNLLKVLHCLGHFATCRVPVQEALLQTSGPYVHDTEATLKDQNLEN